jgi:hypothetical protein
VGSSAELYFNGPAVIAKFQLIRQLPHDENTPAVFFIQLPGGSGIGNFLWIETLALIGDPESDPGRFDPATDHDLFIDVRIVTVMNGIAHRFRECDQDIGVHPGAKRILLMDFIDEFLNALKI